MGSAAHNRRSAAISAQIDRDLADKRHRRQTRHQHTAECVNPDCGRAEVTHVR
jgi:hypothetical protein